MDLPNVTETEGPHTNLSTNGTRSQVENFDVMHVVQLAIAPVGIIGNFTVIALFLSHRELRSKILNRLIVNQSALDLIVALVFLFLTLFDKDVDVMDHSGILGFLECMFAYQWFFFWTFSVSSTYNIVTMTVERYLALVHPLWHRSHFKVKWIYITLALNVSLSIIFHAAYKLPTTKVYSTTCVTYVWPSRLLSSIWGVVIVCIQFVLPVIILIYCYGKIAWTLTRRIDSNLEASNATSKFGNTVNNTFLKARNNTIKTVLVVGICFIICWVNDEGYYMMSNLGYDADWNGSYFKFCIAMVFLNCAVNPFVYLILYQDFHAVLREICCCKEKSVGKDVQTKASSVI